MVAISVSPRITPSRMDSGGNPGMPGGWDALVVVVVVVEFGYGDSISGDLGGCEKSKSRIKSPRVGEFSRTSGLESARPSFLGSSRCPFRKMSSMNLR